MEVFFKETGDLAICHREVKEPGPRTLDTFQAIDRLRFRRPTWLGRLMGRQEHVRLVKGVRAQHTEYVHEYVGWDCTAHVPHSTEWKLYRREKPEIISIAEGNAKIEAAEQKGLRVHIVRNLSDWDRREVNLVR